MKSRMLGWVVVAAGLAWTSTAWSQPSFEYSLKDQTAQTDGGKPTLVLKATSDIKSGKVSLKRSDGKVISKRLGRMKMMSSTEIRLRQPKGTYSYSATIKAKGLDGQSATIGPLEFKVTLVEPIVLRVDKNAADVGKGQIPFKVNRPLDKVSYELIDDKGDVVRNGEQAFGGKYGSLVLTWKPTGGNVSAVRMKAYDVDGFWKGIVLEPWVIDIPHQEVIFEFGKASWAAKEEPKLKSSKKNILEAVRKFSRFRPDMRLYIAGYTDTVGGRDDNRKLSRERAQAIATWFKRNGLKMPIYYQGFGEDAPAVKTPDNTPEPRNRRAIYMLSNAPPPTSAAIPRRAWTRVR